MRSVSSLWCEVSRNGYVAQSPPLAGKDLEERDRRTRHDFQKDSDEAAVTQYFLKSL